MLETRRALTWLCALDSLEQLLAQRHVVLGRLGNLGLGERLERVLDQRSILRRPCSRRCGLEQESAFRQLTAEVVLAGRDLAAKLVPPGAEDVGPGLNRVLPPSRAIDFKFSGPAHAIEVGIDGAHLGLAKGPFIRSAIADDCAQDVVSVSKHVSLDRDPVAHAALGGEAAVVNRGRRVLDDQSAQRLLGRGRRCFARRLDSGRGAGHCPKVSLQALWVNRGR